MQEPPANPLPTSSASSGGVTLRGVLARIVFANAENHYTIGELEPESGGDAVTIAGVLPAVQAGETLELTGEWVRHPQYGAQFKFTAYRSTLPSSVHGIRRFLGSGLVAGIGRHFADRIVDHFGQDTLRILSEDSGRLREVPGIGKKRLKQLKESWDSQSSLREVMVFLQSYGVTVGHCLRLVKHYGPGAIEILKTNPYQVARDISGIGFKTADKIALNLGIATDSPERIDAGILHSLGTAEDEGHTGCTPDDLARKAQELLGVPQDKLVDRLKLLLQSRHIRLPADGPLLQLPALLNAEEAIAKRIHLLLATPGSLPPIKVDAAVDWAQEKAGFTFAPEQAEAVRTCIGSKCSIITGGPGTGKTTILRAVVSILLAKKARLLLASPTGRAAKRMSEATGSFAQTIHRLLRFDPAQGKFTANEESPLRCDCLIVDECSMLDTRLAASLLKAVPLSAHVILVGDVNQLPSVGPGNVLGDLIASGLIPTTSLSQIFRQSERSAIVSTAHNILKGSAYPPKAKANLGALDPAEDLAFLTAPTPEACVELITSLCRDWIPRHLAVDPIMDVQLLAPMHKGIGGIANINTTLQAALNPGARKVALGSTVFQVGDKVIQTINNYEKGVFNGDLGRVTAVNPESGTIAVRFDGDEIDYDRSEMTEIQPAYAISIHKSQGSEFPVVVIPLLKQHYVMLQRNLLYTAITRGRKKVFIVGDTYAYIQAVRNKEATIRQTDLCRKLLARPDALTIQELAMEE